jgi:hypothetical protein
MPSHFIKSYYVAYQLTANSSQGSGQVYPFSEENIQEAIRRLKEESPQRLLPLPSRKGSRASIPVQSGLLL